MIARGYHGQPVYGTSESKQHLLTLLTEVTDVYAWQVLDWALMTNHLHLVLRLREPTLSVGMQRLIGLHAQKWNYREQARGHVYQGRFRSISVTVEQHLRTLVRYVDLNPVRAGLCKHPSDWPWSGYAANAGLRKPEAFHSPDLGRNVISAEPDQATAEARYRRFVCELVPSWARRGHEFEERLPLIDVLVPGQIETWSEAYDLWGYTARDVAALYGVTVRTVQNWLATGKAPPVFPLGPSLL